MFRGERFCWIIVGAYAMGILLGSSVSDIPFLFETLTFLTALLSLLIIFLSNWLRNKLRATLFDTLFVAASILVFGALGIQRYVASMGTEPSPIERRFITLSDNLKSRLSDYVGDVFACGRGAEASKSASLMKALLAGDKKSLDKETIGNFRTSGLSHTLALSGLHIGIVWSFMAIILSFLNLFRRGKEIRAFMSAILIFVYAFATGFSNSVVRAAIMLSLWQMCRLSGRNTLSGNSIISAAFIILVCSPCSLFSIGFQLSFAAVLGIATIYPTIEESIIWLEKRISASIVGRIPLIKKITIWIARLSGISIACQIITLPLVMFYFGSAATYFLISNLIAIPLITLIVYLGAATVLFSPLIAGTSCDVLLKLLLSGCERLVSTLLLIVEYLAK